ncbi:MAG TPA: hypothetical protein VJT67_16420 [Longimicrobiaceae bacterium]|nr:hypothetical protein [Longimicrobiaceae bacterium]
MSRPIQYSRSFGLRRPSWVALSLALLSACARPADVRGLAAGGTVRSLVGGDTAVVLVYRPADVFLCYGSLQPWLEWGKQHPGRFALVLTRPPSAAERTQLASYRIHPAGVLRRSVADRFHPLPAPMEVLMVNGSTVATRRVVRRQLTSPLLRTLTASPTRHPPAAASRTKLPGGEV